MCGILGIKSYKKTEVKTLAYYSMLALQHRGQQSAGISWHFKNNNRAFSKVSRGSVDLLFSDLDMNSGKISGLLGHTRYSTTGGDLDTNIQPFIFTTSLGQVSLVHNGNLTNTKEVAAKVRSMGLKPKGTTDSELIGLLISRHLASTNKPYLPNAIKYAAAICRGAISLIVSTNNRMYGYRDSYGIRPLVLGLYADRAYVLASESCALDAIGATYVHEVKAGTILDIGSEGYTNHILNVSKPPRRCIFEDIYFSRPDSLKTNSSEFTLPNKSIYEYRLELGRQLAIEHPAEVDLIIGTPDSGIPGAIGFAEASDTVYGEGLIKNKYVGRTFIQPTQEMRKQGVKAKLNAIPNVLRNKRVVLVDDSIVRGNTCKSTIQSLYDAGAKEVHMRITSPPVKHPCYFGMDFPKKEELIANNLDLEDTRKLIGAASLGYLSIDAVLRATKYIDKEVYSRGHSHGGGYCTACFTGEYPI